MRRLPKKKGARLGQHFLASRAIASAIARESGAQNGKTILEIGPGKGVLTREILALGASVVAIEKDTALVKVLEETFSKEIKTEELKIIEGDARNVLSTNHYSLFTGPYSVAANIPYYITGELIRLLLTAPMQPEKITLLVQKEVAERIARAKKESLLSLSVKAYGTPRYVKTVKAGSFNPPPSVDSAILAIENISRANFNEVSEGVFFELLHAGFGHKRKTLLGNLKKIYGHQAFAVFEEKWETLGFDKNIRAEDVPLEQWFLLGRRLN